MPIHLQTGKRSSLQTAFTSSLEKFKYRTRRPHRLFILSCYIDFGAIESLIDAVRGQVNLTEVSLAFEFMEAFRSRLPNKTLELLGILTAWCKRRGLDFSGYALRTGALMHAKGSSVVQLNSDGAKSGVVCIGSGNATLPGLGTTAPGTPPNVELAYISTNDEDITSFLELWQNLLRKERRLDDASRREDAYSFSYSLLASGVFLHDWRNSLRSQIGISYFLTPEGRNAITIDDEFAEHGFKLDQASLSRNPLLENVKFSIRRLPSSFSKVYTVDTLLGRWCPMTVWQVVEGSVEADGQFKRFTELFMKATEPDKLDEVVKREAFIAARLTEKNFIEDDEERLDVWRRKIEELRENEHKLTRIFLNFSPFTLPYDYSDRDNVKCVYDGLFESLEIRKKMPLIGRKLMSVRNGGDLSNLMLTEKECNNLKKLLSV